MILVITSGNVDSFKNLIGRVISMNLQQILIDAKEFGFFKSPVKVVEIDSLVNPELLVWILIFLHK